MASIVGEFPGQFSLDEILDMPEDVRYLWHVLASRVGQKKLAAATKAASTGEIESPYAELS